MPLKPARLLQLIVLVALAAGFYAEFVHDVNADNALDYYRQLPQIDDDANAIFTFAGLAAPPAIDDTRAWGFVEVMKNRDRQQRGEARLSILDDRDAGDGRLYLQLPAASQRYACWLPSFDDPDSARGCVSRDEMQGLLQQNALLLERYQQIFGYRELFYRGGDEIGFKHSLALSRLLAIDLWLRREQLDAADIDLLFRFYRFWEQRARNSSLALVGSGMSIVNYGAAASLLARLSEIDPGLLSAYQSAYGKFDQSRLDDDDFDNFVRAEFRSLNFDICFFADPDATVPCKESTRNLYYKPGRTLELLYSQRLQRSDCIDSAGGRRVNSEAVDSDFWTYLFKRPGNFRGRGIARLHSGGMRKACAIFTSLDLRAEQNALRNLYLQLKRDGLDPAQVGHLYKTERDKFKIPGRAFYFDWNDERQELYSGK